jgi:RHS repeat-associated protein
MKATRALGTTLLLAGVLLLAATALRAQSQAVHGVAHGTATWTSSGALIVAQGTSSTGVTDQLLRIVPGQTPSTQHLLVPRADHTATLLPDGSIAVSGGRDDRGSFDSIELFDVHETSALSPTRLTRAVHEHATSLLPDGRLLVTGGRDQGGRTLATVQAVDLLAGHAVELLDLARPRAGHTITVLTNGTVLIAGGESGTGVSDDAEIWQDGGSTVLGARLREPRSSHTATLLPDGTVLLAGGITRSGQTTASLERFDPATASFLSVTGRLAIARAHHVAVLLPSGEVLLWGGVDQSGRLLTDGELYDPATGLTRAVNSLSVATALSLRMPTVLESLPASGVTDVPPTVRLGIRFSEPIAVTSVTTASVRLTNARGNVGISAVPAESGLLLFVKPDALLEAGTPYTLVLDGLASTTGEPLPATYITFTTAGSAVRSLGDRVNTGATVLATHGDPDEIGPKMGTDVRTGRPISRWQDLPSLRAPQGVTAVAGQVLQLNGEPLAGVTLEVEGRKATTDATGRFLVTHVDSGPQVLVVDGKSANRAGATYGVFEIGVNVVPRDTTPLSFSVWMPKIDVANAIRIASPTPTHTVITTPRLPGLALHLPAGTVVRDRDGRIANEITITPVPLDRPPYPTPDGITFAMYFTIQPGGASLESATGHGSPGAWVVYPNVGESAPGAETDFWHYEPYGGVGWYRYGKGRVSDDSQQVTALDDTRLYKFTMFTFPFPSTMPAPTIAPTPTHTAKDGEPVDLGTGLFVHTKTDLAIADIIPITLQRTYRPQDSNSWSFGIGTTSLYDMHLLLESYTRMSLIMPDGARLPFDAPPVTPLPPFLNQTFEHTQSPTPFYKAKMWLEGGNPIYWRVTLLDGTVYRFSYHGHFVSITDRFGNVLMLTRDMFSTPGVPVGPFGPVRRITSPNGRYIDLTYDSATRITEATDNIGRTVSYSYDASGRLATVRDANGGVSEYTYDTTHRMLTLKDAKGITFLTNQYYGPGAHEGRVQRQTQADFTTFEFSYTNNGAGRIIQTDVTNPRGHVRRVTFDSAGYPLTDTRALGQPEQQTITSTRQSLTNFVLTSTDGLDRQTTFTHDAQGNMQSVTWLTGTPQALTTTFGYETPGTGFNRLTSVTTALTAPNPTTTLAYNDPARTITITDALTHQTVVTHNTRGQVLTIKNALNHTTTLGYDTLGNLTSMQDPLGNTTTRAYDGAGRMVKQTDAQGRATGFSYDVLNQLRVVADVLNGTTRFTYDANGNLLSLTDARGNTTNYAYNSMDRVTTRTDPLTRAETYGYDNNGNLQSVTDRKSQTTNLTYDALNRLLTRTSADTSTLTHTWDVGNRLTQAVDSISGTITRTYHPLDGVLTEATPNGTVTYTYDTIGRRATMAVPGQATITYAYDNANRLTTITQDSNVVTFDYDTADRRTQLTYPSGTFTEYAYDNASRLTGLTYKHGTNTLGSLTYGYDATSQRSQSDGTWARVNRPPALNGATYDAVNRQLTFGGMTLTYDLNGNLTGDGTNTYTWSARDQLASISGPVPGTFVYDGLGRRQRKTVNGAITDFTYDGLNPVREAAGATTVDLLTGLGIDEYFMRVDSTSSRNFLSDALGSTVGLTDSGGTVQTEYTYEPFGAVTASGTSSGNELRYTGREDDATAISYYRARYYHPGLQRFISEDPIGFLGGDWNLFSYVRNRPTEFVDPRGLDIAVIENGPTGLRDNPIGHTAMAVTGYGVFSYGNGVSPGSSLAAYLTRQAPNRHTRVHIIKTTPEQDAAAVAVLYGFGARPLGKVHIDNCSSRINAALDAAKISQGLLYRIPCSSPLIPGSAGCRATFAGMTPVGIPQGASRLPSGLEQFEPIVGPW